jgi:enamine deaminase RidA (YjgF/YER057c/UK114 family)
MTDHEDEGGALIKLVITSKQAGAMYNPVSQATLAPNGMFYSAGMVGRSPHTGEMAPTFDGQARQALQNLGALLQDAGCQPEQLYPGAQVMFTAVACIAAA